MKNIGAYFLKERRRLQFYGLLHLLLGSVFLLTLFFQLYLYSKLWAEGVVSLRPFVPVLPLAIGISAAGVLGYFLFIASRRRLTFTFARVADLIEAQIGILSSKKTRGELRSVGHFLDKPETPGESEELRAAHIQYWNKKLPKMARALYPSPALLIEFFVVTAMVLTTFSLQKNWTQSFPSRVMEWTPSTFEIKWPYEGAPWKKESGAMSGIQGSIVRFTPPPMGAWQTFLYVKETGKTWTMVTCEEFCEWRLRERGQYAVGSLFARSSLFPLQVIPDESPHGVLFVKVGGEFVPSATIQAVNQENLQMQFSASDDVRLFRVELMHRGPDSEVVEKVLEWPIGNTHIKQDFVFPLTAWKGGSHQLFLRIYDEFKSSDSSAVTIVFADEETMRAKRISDLRSLLDEWVHVLADLLESDEDQKLAEGLLKRLKEVQYPALGEPSLMTAFIKELLLLSERIERWAKYAPDFSQTKDLVQRTEKEILYGLSLIFQEKTGEVEATSNSLKSGQDQLQELLEKIKRGEMDPSSQELDLAFKQLAEKLEALQKKIRDLPTGPNDDLMNREAMEAQADESESLAKRIEEIKKQMASGDGKGALRELESLLNQLSILSKEMERSLDQWKSNLDQGAMQNADRYTKKLEEIKKRQEELAQKTDTIKEKAEKLEAQNSKTWTPIQPEKVEALRKEFQKLKKQQEKIGTDFKKNAEDFDKEMTGTEFEPMFRSEESKQVEGQIAERMTTSRDALSEQKGFDSLSNQKEAIELIKKAMENQKKMQEQMKALQQQGQTQGKENREKVELLATESKVEKERRRKIMESLQRKVEDRFQKSHEQYFEEQLQR